MTTMTTCVLCCTGQAMVEMWESDFGSAGHSESFGSGAVTIAKGVHGWKTCWLWR